MSSYGQSALMLPVLAAHAAAVLMLGIAAFQVALVFGAPWGAYTQGGQTEGALDTSGRVFAAVVRTTSSAPSGPSLELDAVSWTM